MRRRNKKKDHQINESWLLPYSDLLTLLLALFIVLFAMSEIDLQKYKKLAQVFKNEFTGGSGIVEDGAVPIPKPDESQEEQEQKEKETANQVKEMNELAELQKKINSYIKENGLTKQLGTKLTGEGLLITILNDVSFDPASAKVKGRGKEIAKEISNFLVTDPPHKIVVSGHTDTRPIHNEEFRSNWELSVVRAVNFMHLLLRNEQLNPELFSARGYGEYHPIAPNNSEENMAKNRRVEVLIVPNYR